MRSTVARAAAAYFGIVFGCGFVLGPIRVLALEPRLGARAAELCEAPVMLVAIVLAARWVRRRSRDRIGSSGWIAVGVIAAGLVLVADFAVGMGLRGMSAREVVLGRDPVAGIVYHSLLALCAVAPWLLGKVSR